MTLDDESSVYVGGLPYDATEDSLRKTFSRYGSVVAVKIINDRSTRGKCYGFVTFTNPRSAAEAISDMDGRAIDGRPVRVNGVRTRGGRFGFGRENFRQIDDRGMEYRGRGRGQERYHSHERDQHWDRHSERSRERDQSREHHLHDREREHDHVSDHDEGRDHMVMGERDQALDREGEDNEHEQTRDRGRNQDEDLDREIDLDDAHDGDRLKRKRKGAAMDLKENIFHLKNAALLRDSSSLEDDHSREFMSESDYGSYDEIKEQLEASIQKREELKEEISRMEQKLGEKRLVVLDLQKKSKKLEDSLTSAKKLTSQRRTQLTKLYKCYLQVRDYTERLKSSEQELQSLVDSAYKEADLGDDIGLRSGVLLNGKA